MMKNNIAILRLQLFKPSETFIPAQVSRYKKFNPIYIGRKFFGDIPDNADAFLARSGFFSTISLTLLRSYRPFCEILNEKNISILHAHFAIDAVYGVSLANHLDVPLVTTLHGFDVTTSDSSLMKTCRPALINSVLFRKKLQQRGNVFVCVSDFIREMAIKQGYPEEKTVVLPIGIDVEKFKPFQKHVPGLIVHVARLVEKKGTIYLLRAFAKILKEFPSASMIIIGDGPLRRNLEQEARDLKIIGKVKFLGVQSHVETKKWIACADVVAIPSVTARSGDSEGLPTICFEAAAFGVPVVASYTSGIPEAVIDGRTGLLTSEADVSGIASALQRIMGNVNLRESLSINARSHMEKNFNIINQTNELEKIYSKLVK